MKTWIVLLATLIFGFVACKEDPENTITPVEADNGIALDTISYDPTSYTIDPPPGFPPMPIPADNPMLAEAVVLGRFLFHDKMLSKDFSLSCEGCHDLKKAFTDGIPTSVGVEGIAGERNSMSLVNVGYNWEPTRQHNFNWDGAFSTLEQQVLSPVRHPLEMNVSWDTVEVRLQQHPHYPYLFRKAFGIENSKDITRDLAAKALAQFLRTLNSAGSLYDEHVHTPFVYMDQDQQRGFDLFLGDALGTAAIADAECAHCHAFTASKATFARNGFSNNGLDEAQDFADFSDQGLGKHTGRPSDNGKFREVTLRNIALTAPYMHDGRFATLEEVLDHYVDHIKPAPNLAGEIATADELSNLSAQDKQDIISFLHALTDTSYYDKPEWQDPFEQPEPFATVYE